MDSLLIKIKRIMIRRKYLFTKKAVDEMDADGLCEEDVVESILNSRSVQTKRSTSIRKTHAREKVHIIKGATFHGLVIYTKGVLRPIDGGETFYILISSKKSL